MAEKNIMEMTAAELKALKAGLAADHNPQEVAALDDRIMTVSIEEGVAAGINASDNRRDASALDAAARKRWPDLSNEESDFYKAVNKELEARGDSKTNKRALNDAANKVGLERGMVHHGWAANADTAKIMGIKAPGNPDGNDGEGKSYTKSNPDILEQMSGFLDTKDEKVLAQIDARAEEK